MECVDLNIWHRVLGQIQQELPSQAYETWFQPTRAVASTPTSLTIEVPNLFFRDWIASHYTELVRRTLEKISRSKISVEYSIVSQTRSDIKKGVDPSPETAVQRQVTFNATPLQTNTSDLPLNPRYTFEEFVIGPSNHFAHAASMAVTDSPARVYNPLFIYGGVGLGKTHLMQAIGHRLPKRFPQARCIYISSERFTNHLISAIQNRTMSSFRDKFRSADILLIDDIHFIGGKESTQEVFFHTFNTLYDAHKQIVLSSDRPPKELRSVEDRLVSRFEWGLVTDVQPPDLETRVAILRKKAETQKQPVPDDITLFIAQRVSSNIRELEGALNRVIAYAVLTNREITLPMAQEVLKGVVAETAQNVTLERIQKVVSQRFHLSSADLRSKRRTKEISLPRQIAMALARELTEASLPVIGEAFGGRDHATVIYACRKISETKKNNPNLREVIDNLVVELKQGL